MPVIITFLRIFKRVFGSEIRWRLEKTVKSAFLEVFLFETSDTIVDNTHVDCPEYYIYANYSECIGVKDAAEYHDFNAAPLAGGRFRVDNRKHLVLTSVLWILLFSSTGISAVSPSLASAQWAKNMFTETSHDFGTVTRNSKTEYRFRFQNLYKEDVHVRSVRTSCGCTQAIATTPSLKMYETGEIVATVNTVRYSGMRSVTITVQFDRPYMAEVQLQIYANIRDDIQFVPNELDFGSILPGTSAKKTVKVRRVGGAAWKISSLKSTSSYITAALFNRAGKNSRTPDYEVDVSLGDQMPPGRFREQILLSTSGASDTQKLSFIVQGEIIQPLSLSPGTLFFGQLHPGEKLTKNLSLYGDKPFSVIAADVKEMGDCSVQFRARPGEAMNHLIAVEIQAGQQAGTYEGTVRIQTSVGDKEIVTCRCRLEVVAAGGAAGTESTGAGTTEPNVTGGKANASPVASDEDSPTPAFEILPE